MAQQVLVEVQVERAKLAVSLSAALLSHSLPGGVPPKLPLYPHYLLLYSQASLPHQLLLTLAPKEEGGAGCRMEMRKMTSSQIPLMESPVYA